MVLFLKILLASLLCLILLILYVVYPLYVAINNSADLVANAIPYQQHPQDPDMTILVAGDSTAVGVGAINNKQTIAGRLGDQYPNAEIMNLGVSGARLIDLWSLLKNNLKDNRYNLIVLQIGANDVTHFTPVSQVKEEISAILALCTKASTKTILLTAGNIGLAHIFYWPLSAIISYRTLKIRAIFMDEAAKYHNVSYVDLYKEKRDDPFEKDIKKYYAPDMFHLTGDGYGIWFAGIQKQL